MLPNKKGSYDPPPTAVIIIIGNEILSGKVHDTNSHYLATELRALGVDVRRVMVIPDEIDIIAKEVSSASKTYDYVFTAGGVGPTHDDVTMEGIAKGFGVGLIESERMVESLRKRCGELNEATMRMAALPEGAELLDYDGLFPPVVIRNVYVFPGQPDYLRQKFAHIKERFRSAPFVLKKVFVNEEECFIAHILESVLEKYPSIMIGSYPKIGNPEYKVMLTLESTDGEALKSAFEMLLGLLPRQIVARSE